MVSLFLTDRDGVSRPSEVVGVELSSVPGRFPRACAAVLQRSAYYRRAVVQKRVFSPLGDARYRARLARHAGQGPELSEDERDVLADLRGTGVAVGAIELSADALAFADGIVDQLKREETGRACVSVPGCKLTDHAALVLSGLSPRLLDIAEGYIGLPVRYHGLEVKREQAASEVTGPRRWHLDDEDRRMLKVIVYLSDVDAGSGPFGFVEVSNTARVRQLINRDEDPVSDEAMQSVVPREDWRRVTGPRLTTVYADTAQVFHRVFPPTTTERYSVTFVYSSRNPFCTYSRLMLPPRRMLRRLRSQLTPRQWDALCIPAAGPARTDVPEERFQALNAMV